MMPRNPDRDPSAKADTAELTGILKTKQTTRNAAMTP